MIKLTFDCLVCGTNPWMFIKENWLRTSARFKGTALEIGGKAVEADCLGPRLVVEVVEDWRSGEEVVEEF